jgi:SAM-dependent methyltransferase
MPADWQLPPGVSRSLWEFAADRELPSQESSHLGQSPLLTFDAQLVPRWFSTPGPLVDLGCGSGRSLVDFAAAGFACTGVDLSQPSLEFAAQALRDRGLYANLLRANLCELDLLPAEQFDYALLLFGTLGMIATPQARRQALGHAHRLLRPGGRLALHVHSLWPHLFIPGGRQWLLRDLVRRTLGSPAGVEAGGATSRFRNAAPRSPASHTRPAVFRPVVPQLEIPRPTITGPAITGPVVHPGGPPRVGADRLGPTLALHRLAA